MYMLNLKRYFYGLKHWNSVLNTQSDTKYAMCLPGRNPHICGLHNLCFLSSDEDCITSQSRNNLNLLTEGRQPFLNTPTFFHFDNEHLAHSLTQAHDSTVN